MRITYIGHATLLLELDGAVILTDPNFDTRLGVVLPRVTPPGVQVDRLPPLDAIVISHAHADHLSFSSLDQLPSSVPLLAPPVIARWLIERGYHQASPLRAGNSVVVAGVEVLAGAANHIGARYVVDRWRAEANMYMFRTASASCVFAGDTALSSTGQELLTRTLRADSQTLDVALLPIGHPPWWKRAAFRRGHLTSQDALTLFAQLGARYLIPYHWGTFRHVTSNAEDAINHLRRELTEHPRRLDVHILEPGCMFELPQSR